MRCFWHSLYLFLFLGGDFIFYWLELVELFRLYLGASLCTLPFQLLPHCFYLVGLFMLGGVYFVFLVSNLQIYDYEFFIIICLYCLCLKSRFLLFFTCIFSTHTVMHFCLSVSGNIQVDSIKLLSTLTTDGQQLGLNLCFVSIIL